MSDGDLLDTIDRLHSNLDLDIGSTPQLQKLSYAKELASKRGISTKEITDYCNNK